MNEARNVLIGYEFNKDHSQICYWDRKAGEPISIPTKVGTNLFTFPTALCKMEGKEEWHFGLEAEYFGNQPGGISVENLYEVCRGTEDVTVDGMVKTPDELLSVFIWESLAMLGLRDILKSISGIMDLQSGSVDAVAMDIIVAGYQIQNRSDGSDFKILDESISDEQYGVGFLKGNTELRDKVEKVLEEMAADGTMAKVSEKWFGKDITILGK